MLERYVFIDMALVLFLALVLTAVLTVRSVRSMSILFASYLCRNGCYPSGSNSFCQLQKPLCYKSFSVSTLNSRLRFSRSGAVTSPR